MSDKVINKVVFGDQTILDLTDRTVTPQTLLKDVTAHDASGKQIVGTFPASDIRIDLQWNQETSLPYNFSYGSAIVYNNEIHILGGTNNNYTKHYKWSGSSWEEVSTLPYNFSSGSAVVYNNEIHILGSYNFGTTTKHYKWNGSSWTPVSTLPYDFNYGSAVVYNNEIHILGGYYNSSTYKKHYKWNGSSWTPVSTLPYEFYEGSAVVYNNEIHILGSYGYGSTTRTSHYKWDGSNWETVSTLPYRFYNGATVVYNNKIIILGSDYANFNCYEYSESQWKQLTSMPYTFAYGSAVVYKGTIHIIGGGLYTQTNHYYGTFTRTDLTTLSVNQNGTYYPPSGYSGFSQVDANVPIDNLLIPTKTITANGIHKAIDDDITKKGYKEVIVNVTTMKWSEISTLPDDFYGTAHAVVYNNEIHITGGDNEPRNHYKWDGNRWVTVSTLPSNFKSVDLLVYNNQLHTLGLEGYYIKHYKYVGGSWVEASTIPMDYVFNNVPVVYNNEIHILGATNNGGVVAHFKWSGSDWTVIQDTLPYTGAYAGTMVVYNGELHLLGTGYGTTDDKKKHYKWNGSSWSPVSTLPYTFYNGSAIVFNNEINIFGMNDDNNRTSHYKWNGSSWEKVSNIPYPYTGTTAVVYDEAIHILGGDNYRTNHYAYEKVAYKARIDGVVQNRDLHFVSHVDTLGTWTPDVNPPSSIRNVSPRNDVVSLDNNIYVVTSYTERTLFDDDPGFCSDLYSFNGTSWSIVSSKIPNYLYNGQIVVYNNEIHILGGNWILQDTSNPKKHYKWNGSSWSEVSTLPYDFYNSPAVVYNNEIHILGFGDSSYRTSHYKWNGSSWETVSIMPNYTGSAVVYNNEIHILGYNKQHYKWNGSSWTPVSTLPYNLELGLSVVYNNAIHIFSGYNSPTEHYKWDGLSWTKASTLPYEGYGVVVHNNKIHLFGYEDDETFTLSHHTFTPASGEVYYSIVTSEEEETNG